MIFGIDLMNLQPHMRKRIASMLMGVGCLVACATVMGDSPYAQSEAITGFSWAPVSTIKRSADGSDTWPMTWADDGDLYTAFGDGNGFPPGTPRLSLGFAVVKGPGDAFSGTNIRSSSGEMTGDGASGKKASGMLMVDGTLYMWVRNANNNGGECQLAWSTDRAQTWTWSNWRFAELGYCAFLNFGRNYSGARDNYVYMYSPNTPNAYNETDTAILTRVPKDRVTDRNAYEFFSGFSAGVPQWSADIAQRAAALSFPGGVNRLDVTYNAPLRRYLLTLTSRARAGGISHFSIFDAPEPWGPWTTVFHTLSSNSDVDWGESQHIPSKWISADGKVFHLVFSGSDSFAVRKATLLTGGVTDLPPSAPTGLSVK